MIARSLSICSIFRNEAPYLKEWIEFHLQQGIEHFYLYDNFSTDNPERELRPYLKQGLVTLIDWPIPFQDRGQEKAYDDCITRSKQIDQWVAFIDIDEFLFSPNSRLKLILEEMANHPAVVVNTICYGTNGHKEYIDRPVTERFTRRAPLWWRRNLQRKVILQPRVALRAITPHRFELLGTGYAVNLNGVPSNKNRGVFWRSLYWVSNQIIGNRWLYKILPGWVALLLDPYGGLKPSFGGVNKLRINHYVLRSREEYSEKKRRFQSSQYEVKYDDPYFWYHDQNQIDDPILAKRNLHRED